MSNYIKHLQQLSNIKTFNRKKDYIDYNLKKYLKEIGFENLKVLEIGPGLGEFESYLNEKKVFNIDIVDNDEGVVNYIFKNFRIRNSYLSKNILQMDKKLGKYNFIFLMQVMEHLPLDKYQPMMRILYKHLETKGFLIIVVPNANNPLGLIERYGDLQHTSSFTTQSLKDLVNISNLNNYSVKISGYEIPPYSLTNICRIVLQKILHFILLTVLAINGGVFFKVMTPNIMLVIRKGSN